MSPGLISSSLSQTSKCWDYRHTPLHWLETGSWSTTQTGLKLPPSSCLHLLESITILSQFLFCVYRLCVFWGLKQGLSPFRQVLQQRVTSQALNHRILKEVKNSPRRRKVYRVSPHPLLGSLIYSFIYYLFMCGCACTAFMWTSEDNLWEMVLPFHHMGSWDQTQVIRSFSGVMLSTSITGWRVCNTV